MEGERKIFNRMIKSWTNGNRLDIVAEIADLPAGVRERAREALWPCLDASDRWVFFKLTVNNAERGRA